MQNNDQKEFPLLAHLDGLVDNLRHKVDSALNGEDVDAVHDARVATRRLKAATELVHSVVSGRFRKQFDKVTRLLRKRLGSIRDLDVMLQHLAEMRLSRYQPAIDWLKGRMVRCREEAVAESRKSASASRMLARLGTWWGLRQEIQVAQGAIGSLLAQSVHLQLDTFAKRAAELGAGDPHVLRIAGKSLRYTLEMAKAHDIPLSKSVLARFKTMQEALGQWHDYVVLTERMLCELTESDLALHDPTLAGLVLGLAQRMLAKSQVHLKKMADLWRDNSVAMCDEIRRAFPLTLSVSEPKESEPEPTTNSNASELDTRANGQ